MNIKDLLDGLTTGAIDKVRKIMLGDELGESPLKTYIWLLRLEKWIKLLKERLKASANAEFNSIRAAQPDLKAWQPLPFAVVRIQPAKTTYTYPKEILDLEAEVRAKKEAAKAAKTVMCATVHPDPASDQVFKVALTEC